MTAYDAAVVGSGVIGLSTAWRLAGTGRRVVVVDPNPGRGASRVAAGMLAPVTEATWGEGELVALNVRAVRGWPAFAAELEQAASTAIGFRPCGSLLVAYDGSDRAALEELCELEQSLGLEAEWCSASRCRELEPLLSPGVRGGIHASDEHQVDNRRFLLALALACQKAGVRLLSEEVSEVALEAGAVSGIVAGGEMIATPLVVVAAGFSAGAIGGLEGAVPPLRPVKGQILRLSSPDGQRFCDRNVRALVGGRPVYAVSREDGEIVVGSTQEERGADTTVTAEGVYTILRDAQSVLPGLSEARFTEACAGLRPATPDNAPAVGESGLSGLVVAVGHYRNGILLAPSTGEAVAELCERGSLPQWMAPFSPRRFAASAPLVPLSAEGRRER